MSQKDKTWLGLTKQEHNILPDMDRDVIKGKQRSTNPSPATQQLRTDVAVNDLRDSVSGKHLSRDLGLVDFAEKPSRPTRRREGGPRELDFNND